jgi:hypothetical protein
MQRKLVYFTLVLLFVNVWFVVDYIFILSSFRGKDYYMKCLDQERKEKMKIKAQWIDSEIEKLELMKKLDKFQMKNAQNPCN